MPSRTTVVAGAVAALVVGGLVVLAAPVLRAGADAVAGAGVSAVTTADAEAGATAEPSPEVDPEPAADADGGAVPGGYVFLGHGTWIPAGGAGDCTATAYFWMGRDSGDTASHAELLGTLVDMGPMPYAEGEVGRDADGTIVSYTVAEGDAVFAIGDRLCAEGLGLAAYNHVTPDEIHPGQVLDLDPDPTAVFTPRVG